jgi:hypothetical protein
MTMFSHFLVSVLIKCDKQDQQGKAASMRPSNKNEWQEAKEAPEQKQDRAEHGQAYQELQNET